ncbi:MAG: iron-containing alcohol dehydrogenase, partial [Gammaproteobacteria bacterium]|nr:iron-containing alcohol dehydrogenase [Gammaproteobacteria bacterium]
ESYVSMKANPFTDALAISGLRALRDSLLIWYQNDEGQVEAREKMAYAAWLSGITLAQCGLGSVHGLASPLGAFYPIPHGVVCGSLVAVATEVNIRAMQSREPENPGLPRYARLAEIICEQRLREPEMAYQALVKRLWQWTEAMQLPNLSRYGVTLEGLDHVVAHSRGSSMRTNPVVLTDEEIRSIVERRL